MPIHNAFTRDGQNRPFPAALQAAGPIVAIEIGVHPELAAALTQQGQVVPAAVAGLGLIDTGASTTAVDDPILRQLGIAPIGTIQVGTAGGRRPQQQYPATIRFPQVGIGGSFTFVLGADLTGMGFIALVGRDVLSKGLFIYNGAVGHFILSF